MGMVLFLCVIIWWQKMEAIIIVIMIPNITWLHSKSALPPSATFL